MDGVPFGPAKKDEGEINEDREIHGDPKSSPAMMKLIEQNTPPSS